jgi:hypothetical protein
LALLSGYDLDDLDGDQGHGGNEIDPQHGDPRLLGQAQLRRRQRLERRHAPSRAQRPRSIRKDRVAGRLAAAVAQQRDHGAACDADGDAAA